MWFTLNSFVFCFSIWPWIGVELELCCELKVCCSGLSFLFWGSITGSFAEEHPHPISVGLKAYKTKGVRVGRPETEVYILAETVTPYQPGIIQVIWPAARTRTRHARPSAARMVRVSPAGGQPTMHCDRRLTWNFSNHYPIPRIRAGSLVHHEQNVTWRRNYWCLTSY